MVILLPFVDDVRNKDLSSVNQTGSGRGSATNDLRPSDNQATHPLACVQTSCIPAKVESIKATPG